MIPLAVRMGVIGPFTFDGKKGRTPKQLVAIVRTLPKQVWFPLSDAGAEDSGGESHPMQ